MIKKKFRLVPVDDETSGLPQTARELRKAEILKSAGDVFVEEGYASFSVRNVAKKVGVALSTVQHYYPTKEALLVDMIAEKISGYVTVWRNIAESQDQSYEARLVKVAEDLLIEIKKRDVCAFFFEMFALAQHEPKVSEVLQTLYGEYRSVLKDLAKGVNPELSDTEAGAAALLMAAQMEGLMVFTYHGGDNLPNWDTTCVQAIQVWINHCFPNRTDKVNTVQTR